MDGPVLIDRLDFISFLIEQPNEQSVCSVDSFQVAGAINKVPVICGDNDGQHSIIIDKMNFKPNVEGMND